MSGRQADVLPDTGRDRPLYPLRPPQTVRAVPAHRGGGPRENPGKHAPPGWLASIQPLYVCGWCAPVFDFRSQHLVSPEEPAP